MKVVRTVEDKQIAIQERDDEQRKLGKAIDRVLHRGKATLDGEELGCGGSGEPEARSRSSEISRAVLGMAPSKKKTPAVKLEAAANAMRQRMEVLESRASDARQAAKSYMQSGNRACAVRDLKRSKVFEKQALSLQAVMDAVDTQSSILEQTALQKQVTAALGETAKTLKKEKGLLSQAENAVDAASEMRDMHDDLSQVMAGLGNSADLDEDELLSELNNMIGPLEENASQAENKYDTLEVLRQMPAAPNGTVKVVEKQSLLG